MPVGKDLRRDDHDFIFPLHLLVFIFLPAEENLGLLMNIKQLKVSFTRRKSTTLRHPAEIYDGWTDGWKDRCFGLIFTESRKQSENCKHE